MSGSDLDFWQRGQRGRKVLGATFAVALLGASFIPTNVRAVFLNDAHAIPPKAFAARTPSPAVFPIRTVPASPAAPTSDTSAAAVRPAGASVLSDALAGGPIVPGLPIDTLFPGPTSETAENPLLPAGAQNPSFGRAASAPGLAPFIGGLAGSPPSGSTTPGPTDPTDPTVPTDPVAAVPEPASWAMLLLGFFFIGGAMRRRQRGAGATQKAIVAISQYEVHHLTS